MFKKLIQATLLMLLPLSHVTAKGWMMTCPLTAKTDDHLYRDFVQNCGARVEGIDPQLFEIVFASLKYVVPQDNAAMTQIVEKWTADHKADFQGLSLDLSNMRLDQNEIFATTTFLTSKLYSLRDSLQSQIHSTSFPSGKTYDLDANSYDYHLFSIIIADTKGIENPRVLRALHTLKDRIEQAKIVYSDAYMMVQLEHPVIKFIS